MILIKHEMPDKRRTFCNKCCHGKGIRTLALPACTVFVQSFYLMLFNSKGKSGGGQPPPGFSDPFRQRPPEPGSGLLGAFGPREMCPKWTRFSEISLCPERTRLDIRIETGGNMYITIRNVDDLVVQKLSWLAKKNGLSREEYLRVCLRKIADDNLTADSPIQMEFRQITTILDQMESTLDTIGKEMEDINMKVDAMIDSMAEARNEKNNEGGIS